MATKRATFPLITCTLISILLGLVPGASAAVVGMDADGGRTLTDSARFATLREILADGGHVLISLEEVTEEALGELEGFILLQADEPAAMNLVDTLIDFVGRGGNLLVIADPAIDGDSTLVLNALAGRFGVTYAASGSEIEDGRIERSALPESHVLLRGVSSDVVLHTHRSFIRDGGKEAAVKRKQTPSEKVFMSFIKGVDGAGHVILLTSP
ncbi:MAG: hypothetical protein JSV91_03860, partial [Phycisphaerales bacterium]